ncbi:AAA family ATPase [Heliorestis acidaminivorans]|uniref:AAA family ATPase n=1 Tax=Heliorestis acidaminivorans TaxID=553427 RepID=A0A6I0EVT6_9FIRM|nr:AAA family ATPase [Heliorestis acidaminivorans]KAB2951076.1 AAA family ATPase [Heliorestis acidaminivorans]
MAKVISMINWKGGVGKTTLTLHIGIGLNRATRGRILLVDLDPQCNLSFLALGVEDYVNKVYKQKTPTLKSIFDGYFNDSKISANDVILTKSVNRSPGIVYSNVDIMLSHQELVLLDLTLARSRKAGRDHKEETRNEIEKLAILNRVLSQIKDMYEYILLDCPPNVNLVTQNAFYASDYYVVPAIPDFLSTTGISLIKDYMKGFNKDFNGMHSYAGIEEIYNETKFGGIIFNMVDERNGGPKQTHAEAFKSVSLQHPGDVFKKYVTDGDGISVAASVNLPVYAHSYLPRSNPNAKKQSEYLTDLVDEFIKKIV